MTYSESSPHRTPDTRLTSHRTRFISVLTVLALAVLAALAAPRAGAVTDAEELFRVGSLGEGAGQTTLPRMTATSPTTGHIYAIESGGARVSEFTPWGEFVKAFGWDVAPGPVNEQQEVRVRADAGQFRLSFEGEPTAGLPFNASDSEVEAALNGLASISTGGGSVTVKELAGTEDGTVPYIYVVVFKGSLAGTDVDPLGATNGAVPLSGGSPSTILEASTRADGTAGGGGLESCTEESQCKGGLEGTAPGQISALGIATDSNGAIYVRDYAGNRVQKFDSAGRFLLMFGGGVNKTTGADVCTAEDIEVDGDICGEGSEGSGPGEFSKSLSIAIGPDDTIFIGDGERIVEFAPDGESKGEIKGGALAGEEVKTLAVNPQTGGLYVVLTGKDKVLMLSSGGAAEGNCKVEKPTWLASDPAGNFFVVGMGSNGVQRVFEFDPSCKQISSLAEAELVPGASPGSRFDLGGLSTNAIGDLYVTNVYVGIDNFIRSFGPAPTGFEAPPKNPPAIGAQFASSVDRSGAILAAEINPRFWINTRYYVQYGTGKCSDGGCLAEKPAPPGQLLTSKVVNAPVRTAGVFLEGLQPATTYHYRFVAQSSGGGPVFGDEHAFVTFPTQAAPKSDCTNQAFRTGFSTPLPDCRAYEMVTPVDKNNGDIKSLLDLSNYITGLEKSSSGGDRFTYSSYRAFANSNAAPYMIQYLASRRDGVGWSSEAIVPPQGPAGTSDLAIAAENLYKAFSEDLCSGWLLTAAEPVLAPGVAEGYFELYRRDNCGGEGYEALAGVEPNVPTFAFYPEPQGISADGKKTIFRAKAQLTPDATSGVQQTYYASKGDLRLICILPSGTPSAKSCSGGTGNNGDKGGAAIVRLNRIASVSHALSTDGSRAYWTASVEESGPGQIYLRENLDQEQSAVAGGVCTEAGKGCTVEVSETVSSKAARFLGATPDGSKALFEITEGTAAGNLYEFDREAGESGEATLIGKKAIGVAGTSEDLSYVYYVSTEASAQAISEGAVKGEPNFYLFHEGAISFIATLSATDVTVEALGVTASDVNPAPVFHAARVSADGQRVAFISTADLTGYDNTDQTTGKADSEVYVYEAGGPGPVCVSCNPSGARPKGREVRRNSLSPLATAASIPVAQYQLYYPRSLSRDGSKLFFNSYDDLLPRDTNGKEDVYEWQAAASAQDCRDRGADLYVASSGGCLSLISSGESPVDSEFLDATPGGGDVFFTTDASLLPQDPGLIDVYDARVDGGLPGPAEPPGPCQGDACQNAAAPPNDPTPASASFRGAGNLKAAPRCSKGKVARKGRCVPKKRKQAKKHKRNRETNTDRRAKR